MVEYWYNLQIVQINVSGLNVFPRFKIIDLEVILLNLGVSSEN